MNQVCPHLNSLKVEENIKRILKLAISENFVCHYGCQSNRDLWIFLDDLEDNSLYCSTNRHINKKNVECNSKIVLNIITTEIFCLECETEILDLYMYDLLDLNSDFINNKNDLPKICVKQFRNACVELHIKDYAMSQTSEPNIRKYIILKPIY